MTDTTKQTTKTVTTTGTSSPTTGESAETTEPAKPKYSSGLKRLQKSQKGMSKAQRRLAKAVLKGMNTWEEKRDASSHKHKDGALRDAMKNSAKAYEAAMKIAVKAPRDLLKGMKPMKPRKMLRLFFFPFA